MLAGGHHRRRIRTPLAHPQAIAVVGSAAWGRLVVGAGRGVGTAAALHPHHRLAHHQTQTAIALNKIAMVAKDLTVANSVVASVVASAFSLAMPRPPP